MGLGDQANATLVLDLVDELRAPLRNIAALIEKEDKDRHQRDELHKKDIAEIKAGYQNLQPAVRGASGAIQAMGSTGVAAIGAMTVATGVFAARMAKDAVGAMKSLLSQGIQLNADMERYKVTLDSVYRSQARTNETIQWIVRFSERTPFQVQGLVDTAVQLESVGLEAKHWLPVLGDLAAGFGGTTEKVEQLVYAMMMLKEGSSMAFRSLRTFGITREDFTRRGVKFSKAGELESDPSVAMTAFEDIVHTRFPNLMEKLSTTYHGVLSNIKDITTNVLRDTTQPLFEKVRNTLTEFYSALQKLRNSGVLKQWTDAAGKYLGDVYDRLKSVAEMFVSVSRKSGIGAGLSAVWQEIQAPAERFIAWFADRLARGLIEAIKVGIPALLSSKAFLELSAMYGGYRVATRGADNALNLGIGFAGSALWSGAKYFGRRFAMGGAAGAASEAIAGTAATEGGAAAAAAGGGLLAGASLPLLGILAAAGAGHQFYRWASGGSGSTVGGAIAERFMGWKDGERFDDRVAPGREAAVKKMERQNEVLNIMQDRMLAGANSLLAARDTYSQLSESIPSMREQFMRGIDSHNQSLLRGFEKSPQEQLRLFGENRRIADAKLGFPMYQIGELSRGPKNEENAQKLKDATEQYVTLLDKATEARKEEAAVAAKILDIEIKRNEAIGERLLKERPADQMKTLSAINEAAKINEIKDPISQRQALYALVRQNPKMADQVFGLGILSPELVGMGKDYEFERIVQSHPEFAAANRFVKSQLGSGRLYNPSGGLAYLKGQIASIDQAAGQQFDQVGGVAQNAAKQFTSEFAAKWKELQSDLLKQMSKEMNVKITQMDPINVNAILHANNAELAQVIHEALKNGFEGGKLVIKPNPSTAHEVNDVHAP